VGGDTEESLSAIIGVRAAGDLRPLYLAWLSAYGVWERDEDAFGSEDEDILEPPVPAGLQSLTTGQRALADFLRLDSDLLEVAAQDSPSRLSGQDDPDALAACIAGLPDEEKTRLLMLVAQDQAARAKLELLHRFRGDPDSVGSRPGRSVGTLLDAAALHRQQGVLGTRGLYGD